MQKPLKIAAWSYILLIVLGVFGSIMSEVFAYTGYAQTHIYLIFFLLVIFSLSCLIYNGFINLGKKLNNGPLVKISKAFIFLIIIMGLLFIISLLYLRFFVSGIDITATEDIGGLSALINPITIVLLSLFIIFNILNFVFMIIFGKALLISKDKMKFLKPAGILNIIGGIAYLFCLLMVGILILLSYITGEFSIFFFILALIVGLVYIGGMLVLFVAMILEIIILFKASEKFEEKENLLKMASPPTI